MKIKKAITGRLGVQLTIIVLTILTISIVSMFSISYYIAKNHIIKTQGEMFTRICKDVMGFIKLQDSRVKKGLITLKDAQEEVRRYANGPKMKDGSRDASKSMLNFNLSGKKKDPYMYVWALNTKGIVTLHPFLEKANAWDLQIDGKFTTRDSWANAKTTGYVFRDLWQNPGEPVHTFLAYQEYYEPWDWVVGVGGREEIFSEIMKKELMSKLLIFAFVLFSITLVVVLWLSHKISRPLRVMADKSKMVSDGNLSVKIQMKEKNEIGNLADSYNAMIIKLKDIIKTLKEAVKNVSTESTQLSSSSGSLSDGASQQAASVEQVSSSMEEMLAAIDQNFDNASETEVIALKSAKDAQDGGDAVIRTVSAMKEIATKISVIQEIAA